MKKDYLDQPLLSLRSGCHATYRDFTQHILVTGAFGSGKTPALREERRDADRTRLQQGQKHGFEH